MVCVKMRQSALGGDEKSWLRPLKLVRGCFVSRCSRYTLIYSYDRECCRTTRVSFLF